MIKTVVFDIDNTLYSYTLANEAAFCELKAYVKKAFGWSGEKLELLHKNMMEELTAYMGDVAAIHNRTIRYQNMLEREGCPLDPHVLEMDELYWGTLMEAARPSEGAIKLLKKLRQQGIKIGIGTDMTARIQLKKLAKLGMLPYVDFLVSSEETGVEKPHPRFFARCVEKAGCEKEECLFVGDNRKKDVYGAIDAGLKAIWYCPEGGSPQTGILCAESLAQIWDLLAGL